MRSYERRFMTPRQQIQLGQILGTALYLASLLDKHGIEVDEFDLIALKNL
jgi:hypothetical protein